MGKKSPKGINTIFRQTASALRAARQTEVFSRIKRNIPYLNKEVSKTNFVQKITKNGLKMSKNAPKITKKLTKFAKKVK